VLAFSLLPFTPYTSIRPSRLRCFGTFPELQRLDAVFLRVGSRSGAPLACCSALTGHWMRVTPTNIQGTLRRFGTRARASLPVWALLDDPYRLHRFLRPRGCSSSFRPSSCSDDSIRFLVVGMPAFVQTIKFGEGSKDCWLSISKRPTSAIRPLGALPAEL